MTATKKELTVQYIVNGIIKKEETGKITWNKHIENVKNIAWSENVSTAQVLVRFVEE